MFYIGQPNLQKGEVSAADDINNTQSSAAQKSRTVLKNLISAKESFCFGGSMGKCNFTWFPTRRGLDN